MSRHPGSKSLDQNDESTDGDLLLKNVQDLRKRLHLTQRNLQQITAWDDEPNISSFSYSGRLFSASTPVKSRCPSLGLEDVSPDCVPQRHTTKATSSIAGSMTDVRAPSQRISPFVKTPLSFSNASSDHENVDLRIKLQQLRKENAGLIGDKHRLQSRIEDLDYELTRTETRIRELTRKQERDVIVLKEKLENLQQEAEIQDKTLREVESRYEQVQRQLDSTRKEHTSSLEEMGNLRRHLDEQICISEKNTREKADSVKSLEELKVNFHEYQGKVKEKLKKLNAKEKSLAEEMTERDRKNACLNESVRSLEKELADVREEMARHQADLCRTKDANEQYQQISADMRSLMDVQKAKIGKLQSEIDQWKKNEEELQSLVTTQRERLEKYKEEVTMNRNHLSQLELLVQKCGYHGVIRPSRPNSAGSDSGIVSRPSQSSRGSPHHLTSSGQSQREVPSRDHSFGSDVISVDSSPIDSNALVTELRLQLTMKEAEINSLKIQSNNDENANSSSLLDRNNHATSRRLAELENRLARLEQERTNHKLMISQLETRVSELDSDLTCKAALLRHRNNDLSELQNELSNKNTEMMSLEKELRRKSSKLSAQERQLDDKASELADHIASLQQLRDELAQKTNTVGQLRGQLDEKLHQLTEQKSMTDSVQLLHKQQCAEYEKQIEMLQAKIEKKCDDIKETETVVLSYKHELDQKQAELVSMEQQFGQAERALEHRQKQDNEALQELEAMSSQSHNQLLQMEQTLMICRKEIEMYVDQLTEQERRHQQQLEAKQNQLHDLELRFGDLESRNRLVDTAHRDLELAYDRQEAMLRESAIRIQELEDSQAALQKQLSCREKEFASAQGEASEELDNLRNKLRQSLFDLDDRGQHNQELMKIIEEMQDEKKKFAAEIEDSREDLKRMKNEMEEAKRSTKEMKGQMDGLRKEKEKKAEQVYDLEEQVHLKDAECDKHKARVKEVDEELQRLQKEVRLTHDQLSQLQKLLTQSQEKVVEKTSEINCLQNSLRESQHELLQRSQVCDELDQALKDRTWELEQRASQLSQLDTTFKGRREEAESQICRLEGLLEQRQMDLDHRVNEISDLVIKVGELQRATQNKELELQRYEINATHLNQLLEEKCGVIRELHERMEKVKSEMDEMKMENRDLQQELRLARELHQKEHNEVVESRKEWREKKLEQDRLARELDETLILVKTKDFDAARLAEELAAIRAQQSQLETRNNMEVKRLRHEVEQMKEQHQLQLSNLRDDHTAIVASKDNLMAQHRSQVAELKDTIGDLRQRIQEANVINSELESEMEKQMITIEKINDSVLLKEREIVHLRRRMQEQELSRENDISNRLSAVYSGPHSGARPRSASPRCFSDISKLTEYIDLPTMKDRLGYLDIDSDHRLSLDRKFAPDRDSTSTISSRSNYRPSRSRKRESRSNFSGIFTASESEGEENADSFVVMLKEVNNRLNKNREHNEDANEEREIRKFDEETFAKRSDSDETLKSESVANTSNRSIVTVQRGPVIRIPSGLDSKS